MDRQTELKLLVASDNQQMRVLAFVKKLALPDCWIAAGFVRNCVWDHVHGHSTSPLPKDIDVVWYDRMRCGREDDAMLKRILNGLDDTLAWSVKNQARMHNRNGDKPYASTLDAMAHWPETATAVGVRLGQNDMIEVAAPYGLDDLFDLIVKPTGYFESEKYPIFSERVQEKKWKTVWPALKIEA